MSRLIKFRAWYQDKMYDVESIDFVHIADSPSVTKLTFWNIEKSKRFSTDRKAWEVPLMQYTGLKDKNGTDVYEGDLLGHESRHLKSGVKAQHEVKWNTERACFEMPAPLNQFEVIGNVYENQRVTQ